VAGRPLAQQSPEGAFQVVANIAPRYGGTGQDQLAWMLCDAPLLLDVLARWGLRAEAAVQLAAGHLEGLVRANGWPCAVAPALKFRGPGRKSDPCPYATLVALRALAEFPEFRDGQAARWGAEALLGLWAARQERRPYLFAMGTHFDRLKAPLIWYDLLHVTDVLTRFPWLRGDPRLREMLGRLAERQDEQGRFTPESAWEAWKDWKFGQKKAPSPWITFLAGRILRRAEGADPP
jgi:hypothetical protein